jgi:hypothetical protein
MNQTHKYNNNFKEEYQKAIQFLEKGCNCGCSAKLPKEKFAKLCSDFQSLSKKEQDAYVMANLISMDEGEETTSSRFPKRERTNQRFFYRWNNITPICQETYFNMLGISLKYFENVKSHLLEKGLSTRVHGNTGKIPIRKSKMVIKQNIKEEVKRFILNYAETCGLPNPGRTKRTNKTTIFLPTDTTYKSVYLEFITDRKTSDDLKQLKYRSFCKI